MSKGNGNKTKYASSMRFFPEIWGYAAMILFCNIHIITGNLPNELVFFPNLHGSKAFLSIATHPFVHVSWYHLLLDGAGFFIVYKGLHQPKMMKRLAYVLFCCIGSVLLPLWYSPYGLAYGLCGLSGIAHGLMAVSALEMSKGKTLKVGILCLFVVVTKSIIEAVTGKVIFSFLHFGLMGLPVASTHLGGVLGGCIAYGVLNEAKIFNSSSNTSNRWDGSVFIK
ncbi:MAG: rhomboid family intramembrane serine protease [Desulfobacterium sp.]|nr:rhomboid family intramembrane serine protease [Desulfobacterium sp.]MBU3948396.1 rhomboid family intramembrane serine protease [Pseudomonadota bacterium]MBU4035053.1 rhomboid family intramembrane serine protease [Pseudomonadota bacterium]